MADDKYKYLTLIERLNLDRDPGTVAATECIARTPAQQGKRCGDCVYAGTHPDLPSHERLCMEEYGIKSLGSVACNVFVGKAEMYSELTKARSTWARLSHLLTDRGDDKMILEYHLGHIIMFAFLGWMIGLACAVAVHEIVDWLERRDDIGRIGKPDKENSKCVCR